MMNKRTFLALFMCVALILVTACGTNGEEPVDVPEDRVDQPGIRMMILWSPV